MTENNAAQAVQESERNAAVEEYFGHRAWIKPTASNFRLFEAGFDRAYALLSKLRAEGVQAGDKRFRSDVRELCAYAEGSMSVHIDTVHRVRAALASAPVAGEAHEATKAAYERGRKKGNEEARSWPEDFSHENGNYMCKCHRCNQIFHGHKRRVTCKVCHAAPQASEAVRQQLADSYREELDKLSKRNYELRMENAALKTQADKDGGDCAKGAGENLLDYAMAIAHERELDVLGHKHNSDEAVDRFKAAVERALSPTPSVVKHSLTATQTGEKGESE